MSELEDLEDIAATFKFGTAAHTLSRFGGRKSHVMRCGSPDHMQGENVRVYRKAKNGKIRTVCRLCDRVRRGSTPECRP